MNVEEPLFTRPSFYGLPFLWVPVADRSVTFCRFKYTVATTVSARRFAALCHDELTAEMSRRHNNANILCLPADLLGEELARRLVDVWLVTEYEGGRYDRRVQKITDYENNGQCAS